MPRTSRTFIGITVPKARAIKLQRLQTLIAPEVPTARWTPFEQFHLTLAFLGDVDERDLTEVCNAVAEVAQGFDPFDLSIMGLGVFPDLSKPRVLWAGLEGEGLEPLYQLRQAICAAMVEVGYAPEPKFQAHLTLGRIKLKNDAEVDLSPLLRHFQTWNGGLFEVSEVVTFGSELAAEVSVHTAFATAPLLGMTR